MPRHAIAAEQLRWQPRIERLPAESTRDIAVLDGTLGQATAAEALGYGIDSPGYNQHVFVRGPRGSGRRRLVESLLASRRPQRRQSRDFCFVHNFANPDRPSLITLPRGEGKSFQKQMHRVALFIRERLPEILANDPIRARREARREAAERDIQALLRPLERRLDAEGLALVRSQSGPNARLQVSVKIMGKPVSQEEFRNMVARKQATEEDRKKIEARIHKYDEEIHKVSSQIRKKWQGAEQHVRQIDIAETARILGEMTAEIAERFKARGIDGYLRGVIDDVLEKRIGHETGQLADPTILYGVNVLNMGEADRPSPVVSTHTVTPINLFGTVDPTWRSGGRAVASYLGIRSGALIQADGGFLLLDAEDLVHEPDTFRQLLRILRSGEVSIAAPTAERSQSAQSLRPQAIPVDVGVILVGDEESYGRLDAISREFTQRFRLLADLDPWIANDSEGIKQCCRFLAGAVQQEQLPPLSAAGMAAVLELAHRLADRAGRLTTRVGRLSDILREAAFVSRENTQTEMGREHVESAYTRIRLRAGVQWRHRLRDDIDSERLRLRGRHHGQVNTVTRQRHADEIYGVPVRLSATLSRSAEPGLVIDSVAGAIHTPAFIPQVISSLLHLDTVPAFSATLMVDPPLADEDHNVLHLGLACCLIAELAGVPLRQDMAVMGSVDARGRICRIDHVNERIEGFFEACGHVGLTGQQAVVIPLANRDGLALDRQLVKACANDQFHVYAVSGISEALELLTDKPAGIWKEQGFSEGSVLALARDRANGLTA